MQFLYNKHLGKIWCSAVLKALTSNKDMRYTVRILIIAIDRQRVVSALLCVLLFGT